MIKTVKKYIDYFFWKRTWFRAIFILLPTLAIVIALLFNHLLGENIIELKKSIMVIYFILFFAALNDNNNIDNPENPFNKKDENE